jgi:hypothetical protein
MWTILALALTVAALQPSTASAGLETMPTRIEVEKFTCGDLLALPADRQERALIYFTGVVDGRRQATAFDAVVAGAAIDRLLAACRTTPTLVVRDALIAAFAEAMRGTETTR